MSMRKTGYLMFGLAVGISFGAVLIGLGLIGLAVGLELWRGPGFPLREHPLLVAGAGLLCTSIAASLPLLATWLVHRR